ncbi:PQQ-dependent sugar dehydrogenase [Pseudonocardia endophytica]|uniref:Glucose/arabinose dehydrogenase n=1 Tax=Pseudonocardia endophytica TaxID=401976 RepID=A0A4V2PI12_PSEEN|nr:gluconolaconase [Pseudonocardia endophytica]TCK22836.1 glucose/arabinose dehydrogenase [Pseudonocardia endophytica]
MRHSRTLLATALAGVALVVTTACAGPNPVTNAAAGGEAPSAAAPSGLVPAALSVPAALAQDPLDAPRTVQIPAGWTMSVFARVPDARLAAWAPDRTLLVSVPEEGRIVRLVPDGRGGATESTLLEGLDQPHGMAFTGSTLYVAQSDRVDAYAYADGRAAAPRPVVTGLPDAKSPDLRGAYAHALKSVAVGPDGAVYVSVGSTGNISEQDLTATPPRASILRVPPGGGPAAPFAVGVRNGTGLAVAPDGAVWTAVNNRDNIQYPYDRPYANASGSSRGDVIDEYVTAQPAEALAKLTPGRNLGWPYCNPDPDEQPGVAGSPQRLSDIGFVNDQETNPDGSMLDCAALPLVEQGFPAHSAPLGLAFTDGTLPAPYADGALAGVHGSWNASPPRAPEVSFFPRQGDGLGPQQTLVGGFQDADGSRWGRPVAAVAGPDGAVYVTDDEAGAVYRLAPPGR